MNRTNFIFIYIWLIVLTIIGIVTLVRTFYREVSLEVDYSGIIVGILSALCTVLIGWQIYSLIDFNNRERKNKKEINKLLGIVKGLKENGNRGDYLLYDSLSDVYENILTQDKDNSKYERIHFKINAINYASRINAFDICALGIDTIENFILLQTPCLNKEQKDRLLKFACSIPNQQSIENFTKLINILALIKTKM